MNEGKAVDLEELSNQEVIVNLKGGQRLEGILAQWDDYMNLVLKKVKEYKEEELLKEHELVVVKGGNIQSISI